MLTADRKKLNQLEQRAKRDVRWRCSEWLQAREWYDARSDVAHGDGTGVTRKLADQAQFWVLHYLTEPVLEWLGEHPDHPLVALDTAIAALPDSPDWDEILA